MVIHVVLKERGIEPEFIIMYPALGCPGIAEHNGGKTVLHVVLLVKDSSQIVQDCTSSASKQAIASRLSYSNWPTNTFGTGTKVSPADITDIQWDQGWTLDRDTIHNIELSAPPHALSKLKSFGYDGPSKLLHLHLQVSGNKGLYNLVNRDLESEVVRKALRQLRDPDGGTPSEEPKTLGYGGKSQVDVELYHPFLITDKEYLNVAHVADPHISTHWELYERRLKNGYRNVGTGVAAHFNNYNKRFLETLREINSDPEIDVIILAGDLIDYNVGHIIDVSGADGGNVYDDGNNVIRANYRFNRNWVFFYELLLSEYKKPIFTILGNHEYLLNPYPTTLLIGAYAIGIRWGRHTESFAGDMNLIYRPQLAEARRIAEVWERRIRAGVARNLRAALRDHNEAVIGRLITQNAGDLIACPRGLWCHTREAVSWYHLVINPFADFTLAHQDQSFLMLDWKGARATGREISQVGSLLLLPKPVDCISGYSTSSTLSGQADIVDRWLKSEAGLKILCTHAPILDPWPDIGNYDLARGKLRRNLGVALEQIPSAARNRLELDFGTIEEESRQWLLSELLTRARKSEIARKRSSASSPPEAIRGRVLVLSGHSHTNRMFQFRGGQLLLMREDLPNLWDLDVPFIIVTNSCGPTGRDNEVSQWKELVPPGYRAIKFENGRVKREKQIRFTKKDQWLRDIVKNEVNVTSDDSDDPVFIYDTHSSALTDFDGESGLIQKVDGKYEVDDVDDGNILVIKKIERNHSVTIKNNDGIIVVLENEGTLTFNDNDVFARVSSNKKKGKIVIRNNGLNAAGTEYFHIEENMGTVIIKRNNDQIRIGSNAKGGTIDIESNGRWSGGDDVIEIKENHGKVTIRDNDDTIIIKDNYNLVTVLKNTQKIRVHKNIPPNGRVTGKDANTVKYG